MRACVTALLALTACSSATEPPPVPTAAANTVERPVPAPSASEIASAAPERRDPCAGTTMKCVAFDDAKLAFDSIVAKKPLVLALGETHAQKGSENVTSTTKHFTDGFLPLLKDKASSLVLELWVADGSCGKKKEATVKKQQAEVTKSQSSENQNEFVALGQKSRELGVIPFVLKPTCDEYDAIQKAGDDAVFEMLKMITRHMRDKTEKLLVETEKKSPGKMVVTYGGAMHNDLAPREGRQEWSYAAALVKASKERYVELDLIVPEFVGATESWKAMPWYPVFEKLEDPKKAWLVEVAPSSYALIFPRQAP